jgi:hypothetical protein
MEKLLMGTRECDDLGENGQALSASHEVGFLLVGRNNT